jgi:hypothetical protein
LGSQEMPSIKPVEWLSEEDQLRFVAQQTHQIQRHSTTLRPVVFLLPLLTSIFKTSRTSVHDFVVSRQCDMLVCDIRQNHFRVMSQRSRQLLLFQEVHISQRDNEYVLSGYRYILPHLLLQIVPTADLPKHTRLGVTLDLRR